MNPTLLAPPGSRNAPCPCGSGRRYKDCHGRAAAGDSKAASPDALLDDAVAAQKSGRYADAIALCDRAIVLAPTRADAWHLRGVLWLQVQDFVAAQRDLQRALEIAPAQAAVAAVLAAAREGHHVAGQEDALCREILSRYRPLVVDPPCEALDGVDAGQRVMIVDACLTGPSIADALDAEARGRGASVERFGVNPLAALAGAPAARLGAAGAGAVVVCVGCSRPLGDWTIEMRPSVASLVIDRVLLTQAVDRLRELAGRGRRRVRLVRSRGAPPLPSSLPHVDGGAW